jgi:hypothetical protein
MNTPTMSDRLFPAERRAWFNQQSRERKWWLLIVGVVLATILILALLRAVSRPAYVVPVAPYPATRLPVRTSDPLLNGRTLNFPATAINNFPVYPVGAGGQVMPYVNRTNRALVVKEAHFMEKNAGRPLIPGSLIDAYEIRFEPIHYDASLRRWGRVIDDLTLPASAETRVVVRVVDPIRAGQRVYGTLVLRVDTGEIIQFEASQIIVQAD